MPIDANHPDFAIRLYLHPDAAHLARCCAAHVDEPSGTLRDDVMLLTSEVVTRAIRRSRRPSEETVELRVWMPHDVVRVELRAHDARLLATESHDPDYERQLLDEIADRWSIESRPDLACFWFEIDRGELRRQLRSVEPRSLA
jgi:hypothetical protein